MQNLKQLSTINTKSISLLKILPRYQYIGKTLHEIITENVHVEIHVNKNMEKFSRVWWGGMGIKTGIFEMIFKLFKTDIQQLKNNS